MLLDPDTFELVPRAPELLGRIGDDHRYKLELPAAQLEIVTQPDSDLEEVGRQLGSARRDLAAIADGLARPACAGVHPSSCGAGELNRSSRYVQAIEEYGSVARRQLVCALQVHVSLGDSSVALPVYNAARSFLPLLAAVAANAPFYEGRDTGLASVRPKLAELLPRQGVPPPLGSWEEYAEALRWGASSRTFKTRSWWWELRPHPRYGTLEFRVPDAQSTVSDALAVAALVRCLVAWLARRASEHEFPHVAPTWRIEENRWSACRHGMAGDMVDLRTGERRPTREHLAELVQSVEPLARELRCSPQLASVRRLAEENGAAKQRGVAGEQGVAGVARWLAARFLDAEDG